MESEKAGLDGGLAIGCFASICRNRLADDLLAFAVECPDVELGVHEMARASVLPALRNGELALVILPDTDHAGLSSMELWRDGVMVALPHNHPLAKNVTIAPEDLLEEVFLVSRQQHGGDMHRFLIQQILPDEPSLNSVLVDLSQSHLLDEVAAGKGVSLVCASHNDRVGLHVALRPVGPADAQFGVSAYWMVEQPHAALAALIAILDARRAGGDRI